MFLKIILGLALFIVIAALGANSGLGDGFFSFKAKGKAADLVEFSRDIATVMQTYKADHNSNLSVVNVIDNDLQSRSGGQAVDGSTTNGDDIVHFANVVTELQQDGLLKGDGSYEIGGFAVVSLPDGDGGHDLVLVNSSADLSDEICEKLNEVVGATDVEADLSTVPATKTGDVVNTAAEFTPAVVTTLNTAATAVNSLIDGQNEGVCIKNSGAGAGQNTFMFYVQKS